MVQYRIDEWRVAAFIREEKQRVRIAKQVCRLVKRRAKSFRRQTWEKKQLSRRGGSGEAWNRERFLLTDVAGRRLRGRREQAPAFVPSFCAQKEQRNFPLEMADKMLSPEYLRVQLTHSPKNRRERETRRFAGAGINSARRQPPSHFAAHTPRG